MLYEPLGRRKGTLRVPKETKSVLKGLTVLDDKIQNPEKYAEMSK